MGLLVTKWDHNLAATIFSPSILVLESPCLEDFGTIMTAPRARAPGAAGVMLGLGFRVECSAYIGLNCND